MSIINRKPYIESVVESLTKEQLTTLQSLIDGSSNGIFRSLINDEHRITTNDKGVSYLFLETEGATLSGYLLYNNTYCVMVYFNATQILGIINIDINNLKYQEVNQFLDINEFRRVIKDCITLADLGDVEDLLEQLDIGEGVE